MTLTLSERRRRDWTPTQTKVPREEVLARLRDRSRTLSEIGAELGYSESWLQHLGSVHEIPRHRGGDRRSPAARARFARSAHG